MTENYNDLKLQLLQKIEEFVEERIKEARQKPPRGNSCGYGKD